jgi:hypothetical protein
MDPHAIREFIQVPAAIAAAGRLVHFNLAKRYPALLWYLGLLAVMALLAGGLPRRSVWYFWFYFAQILVVSAVGILAVRELIALIFADYPGIRTVGRWALYVAIGLSFAASLFLTQVFAYAGPDPRRKWGLFYIELCRRSIVFSLVVAILVILFAISKYPLNLGRNTYLSCIFFSALFLIEAAQLLADSSTRLFFYDLADWIAAVCLCACLFAWAFLLQPYTAPAPRIAMPTAQEDHLLQQLESFNRVMTRASRR